MTESAGDGSGRIRSIAVHRDDVASALEATLRSDRAVVMRVTPPFSGRMRARLHALDAESSRGATAGESDSPAPIHVNPEALVSEVPAYPEADETAAAHPDADLEARRRLHEEAVESWRDSVRESIVGSVAITVGDESHEVDVTALG